MQKLTDGIAMLSRSKRLQFQFQILFAIIGMLWNLSVGLSPVEAQDSQIRWARIFLAGPSIEQLEPYVVFLSHGLESFSELELLLANAELVDREQTEKTRARAQIALEEGLALLDQKEIRASIKFFRRASEAAALIRDLPGESKLYITCTLHLVVSYLKNKQKKEAKEKLSNLLRLYPDLSPERSKYPKRLFSMLKKLKKSLKKKGRGKIVVESVPIGVEVYLNGAFVGTSPVTIKNIPKGAHVVVTALPSGAYRSFQVKVKRQKTVKVTVDLLRGARDPFPEHYSARFMPVQEVSELCNSLNLTHILFLPSGTGPDTELHLVNCSGNLTGAFKIVGAEDEPMFWESFAELISQSIFSPETEIYLFTSRGLSSSDIFREKLEGMYRIVEQSGNRKFELGFFGAAWVGGGIGYATEATEPGLALSILFLRLDLGVSVDRDLVLGLAGRFQIVDSSVVVTPFMRVFFLGESGLFLQLGVPIGKINVRVLQSNHHYFSSGGIVGVNFSTGAFWGLTDSLNLNISLDNYLMITPNPTYQLDLSLGVGYRF